MPKRHDDEYIENNVIEAGNEDNDEEEFLIPIVSDAAGELMQQFVALFQEHQDACENIIDDADDILLTKSRSTYETIEKTFAPLFQSLHEAELRQIQLIQLLKDFSKETMQFLVKEDASPAYISMLGAFCEGAMSAINEHTSQAGCACMFSLEISFTFAMNPDLSQKEQMQRVARFNKVMEKIDKGHETDNRILFDTFLPFVISEMKKDSSCSITKETRKDYANLKEDWKQIVKDEKEILFDF